jgi:hypothetical protein
MTKTRKILLKVSRESSRCAVVIALDKPSMVIPNNTPLLRSNNSTTHRIATIQTNRTD